MRENTRELHVADLMTRSVHTLTAMQSLTLAESTMDRVHVRHIPVVDDAGHVVGLVTHRDLLRAKISALVPLTDDERTTLELSVPVSRVMRTQVWTIAPLALAVSAARIMREHGFGCLPVVDGGKLVGIITEADLLALVTDALSLDRPARPWTMERVMTRIPVTISPEATLADARAAMSRYGIRHLPVVEHGRSLSIVTDRELAIAEAIFAETDRARAAHVVRLLGGPPAHRVLPSAHLDAVVSEMAREHRDAVLVEDESHHLVGIFTAVDACRLFADASSSARSPHRDRAAESRP